MKSAHELIRSASSGSVGSVKPTGQQALLPSFEERVVRTIGIWLLRISFCIAPSVSQTALYHSLQYPSTSSAPERRPRPNSNHTSSTSPKGRLTYSSTSTTPPWPRRPCLRFSISKDWVDCLMAFSSEELRGPSLQLWEDRYGAQAKRQGAGIERDRGLGGASVCGMRNGTGSFLSEGLEERG